MAANLASLKLTTAKKPAQVPIVQFRRNKLSKRLWEQIQFAKAQQSGVQYVATRSITATDSATGVRQTIEKNKRIKPWWFKADNGKLAVFVRYGASVLQLNNKGMSAVEVEDMAALVPTLETLKAAVEAGELDAAIEAASAKLRSGFKK